jgi:hypothetical protein
VDRHLSSGGDDGLEPYFTMLPGGKSGWLMREMQEMFFYLQILAAGVDSAQEKQVGGPQFANNLSMIENLLPIQIEQFINIADAPDFMRGLGFYPTEFQVNVFICNVENHIEGILNLMRNFIWIVGLVVKLLVVHLKTFSLLQISCKRYQKTLLKRVL